MSGGLTTETLKRFKGPLSDKQTIDISSDDYINANGFVCQVAVAGNLTYQTLHGSADQTETGLSIGDAIHVAGIPVLLKAVRASSTVTSITVGIL